MRRFESSNGHGVGKSPARTQLPRPEPEREPADGSRTEAAGEAALASWVGASLLGILLGLGVAKYAQAWAGSVFQPAAAGGAAIVLASALLCLVAIARYLQRRARSEQPWEYSPALAVLSLFVIILLALIALVIIVFAGWEFPPRPVR